MECVILAGGLGTRLRSSCPDLPKPMAPIHGTPFLEYLMGYWIKEGITHFILSVGYLHQKIIDHFGPSFNGIPITYVIEKELLGTGGGLLLALSSLKDLLSPFLVLNGDTFFEVPLSPLLAFQKQTHSPCTLSLAAVPDNSRYDGVKKEESGLITSLSSKERLINGGCYLFLAKALSPFSRKCSLEKEILPYLIQKKQCYGLPLDGTFIDIGIPKDYNKSKKLFA